MGRIGLSMMVCVVSCGCERAAVAPVAPAAEVRGEVSATREEAGDASPDVGVAAQLGAQDAGADAGADFFWSADGAPREGAFGISGRGEGRGGVMRGDPLLAEAAPVSGAGVTIGASAVEGELDVQIVQRIARAHRGELRACYARGLERDKKIQGELKLVATIGARGHVSHAKVEGSELGAPDVERCVADRVSRWSFPRLEDGGEARVRLVFGFGG